jgi:hypothetical protein
MKFVPILAVMCASTALNAADPFVGTYRFNAAKSTMVGAQATAELVLTIEEDGENLTLKSDGRRVDGVRINDVITVPKSGGVAKLIGTAAVDSVTMVRENATTMEWTGMRQGQANRIRYSLSPDGRTLTRTNEGVGRGVSVLERQS